MREYKWSSYFMHDPKWLELLNASVTLHIPTLTIDFPRDRKDAKFLECGQSSKADLFITEDRDFEEAEALTDAFIISAVNFAQLFMQNNNGMGNN